MNAETVSVPLLCCSAPRAVNIIAAARSRACAPRAECRRPCTPVIGFDSFGPVLVGATTDRVEAARAFGDVALIDQVVADDDVQQAEREREVGARRDLQVQRRRLSPSACGADRSRSGGRRRPVARRRGA